MPINFIIAVTLSLAPLSANGSEYDRAFKYGTLAFYKQTGLNKRIRYFGDKLIPKEFKEYGWIYYVGNVTIKRRLAVSWSF